MAEQMVKSAIALLAGCCLLDGCAASSKLAVDTAFASAETRRDTMEATLRVLDQNPTYTDEFFQVARSHPATLDRFISDTAAALHERALSEQTAKHLVQHPAGLRRILEDTLE